ncbi:MAG: hypothetical protein K6A68_15125, partial [Clostridiales bacterium]|nr:hypothetical protein [Clostridiales bacterium]
MHQAVYLSTREICLLSPPPSVSFFRLSLPTPLRFQSENEAEAVFSSHGFSAVSQLYSQGKRDHFTSRAEGMQAHPANDPFALIRFPPFIIAECLLSFKCFLPFCRVVSRSRSKRIKRIVINENLLIWTGLREPDGRTHKKSAKYPYRVSFR